MRRCRAGYNAEGKLSSRVFGAESDESVRDMKAGKPNTALDLRARDERSQDEGQESNRDVQTSQRAD